MSVEIPLPRPALRLDGVVVGVLLGLAPDGSPQVAYPGCPAAAGLAARSTAALDAGAIGCPLALMFEDGDPARPLVIGRLLTPPAAPLAVERDGECLELCAEREIVLRCGQASITLTREGKVLIRGAYLSSRSSGVNRIKGGSVQIN